MYLLDTNVISALAPTKNIDAHTEKLREAFARNSDDLYLSVVTAAEIHDGIAKLFREGATRKASTIREWWATIEHLYGDRILPLDLKAAHTAGLLLDRARSQSHTPDFADVCIAATAMSNEMIILTRNLRHFRPLTIACVDPFDPAFVPPDGQ